MTKYSERKKLEAVEAYEAGAGGLRATAEAHAVGVDSLRKWIAAYRARGVSGIVTKKRGNYDADFKLEVLRRMRDEGLSCRQVAALYDVRRFDQVAEWDRLYQQHGAAGLIPGRKGVRTPMEKSRRRRDGSASTADDERSREDLLREVQQLRMENAYLKKTQALVRAKSASVPKKGR